MSSMIVSLPSLPFPESNIISCRYFLTVLLWYQFMQQLAQGKCCFSIQKLLHTQESAKTKVFFFLAQFTCLLWVRVGCVSQFLCSVDSYLYDTARFLESYIYIISIQKHYSSLQFPFIIPHPPPKKSHNFAAY